MTRQRWALVAASVLIGPAIIGGAWLLGQVVSEQLMAAVVLALLVVNIMCPVAIAVVLILRPNHITASYVIRAENSEVLELEYPLENLVDAEQGRADYSDEVRRFT